MEGWVGGAEVVIVARLPRAKQRGAAQTKVTRISSPGSRSESPDRRGEQAGTLPLAFADLYSPMEANGGAGPGSMHPEI